MNEGPFPNESAEGLSPEFATAYAGVPEPDGPAKRAGLAGLGAVATACDVANETYDRFVHRGSQAQEDLRRRFDDARLQSMGNRSRLGDTFRSLMNTFLDGINVPNKADVDVINSKLNIVLRKFDDLQMDAVQQATHPASAATPDVEVAVDETPGAAGI